MNTQQKNRPIIYVISSLAAIAGMLFGYDTGVISGAILFISKQFGLTPFTNGMVVSAVLLGALIGAGGSGRITDSLGRRKTIMITSLIFILASIASALAQDAMALIITRIFLGIAIGVASYTAPLYLAEIAPAKIRGFLVSLNQLAITIGIVLAYIIDYFFAPTENWRMMLGFGAIPALILLLGVIYLPESPRWLILKGFTQQGRLVLQKIRGDINVENELQEIVENTGMPQTTWRALLTSTYKPILQISLGLAFFQQVTGINTIIYYAPTIFVMAGFKGATSAILATLGVGIVNVLFTIVSILLLDRLGRRPLLLFGIFGMMLSLVGLGSAFSMADLSFSRWIAVASMVAYIACFAIGLGPIVWLMISEVFPLPLRAIGTSVAVCAVWLCNMIVALTFLSLIHLLGGGHTFWLYALFCLVSLVFVYKYVPETNGCALEQIEKNLMSGKPARELGQPLSKRK